LYEEKIPIAEDTRMAAYKFELDPTACALSGGEDYELLFTAPRSKSIPLRIAGIPIHPIGHITRTGRIFLMNRNGAGSELKPQGWEHFRR